MPIFRYGPTGNAISVDTDGRILTNGGTSGSTLSVFSNGENGYPVKVDASGRLMIADTYIVEQPVIVTGSGTSIDFADGIMVNLSLSTSGTTLDFSNVIGGADYKFVIHQNPAGSGTITWPAEVQWPGGTIPTLTATANTVDFVLLHRSDTDSAYYGRFYANFS